MRRNTRERENKGASNGMEESETIARKERALGAEAVKL